MADYRNRYEEIRAAGAEMVAVSVDPPEKSEALRVQLSLPFTILCDTDRRVVQEWNIYNHAEKGGIAIPAIFVIGADRIVRQASVDSVAERVPALEIVRALRAGAESQPIRRKYYFPAPSDWARSARNAIRLGVRSAGRNAKQA